jgi:hypothetical protein
MQNVASTYMPQLENIRETRRAELLAMKELVRIKPEEVEAWFAREIAKLDSMNVSDIMSNLRQDGQDSQGKG